MEEERVKLGMFVEGSSPKVAKLHEILYGEWDKGVDTNGIPRGKPGMIKELLGNGSGYLLFENGPPPIVKLEEGNPQDTDKGRSLTYTELTNAQKRVQVIVRVNTEDGKYQSIRLEDLGQKIKEGNFGGFDPNDVKLVMEGMRGLFNAKRQEVSKGCESKIEATGMSLEARGAMARFSIIGDVHSMHGLQGGTEKDQALVLLPNKVTRKAVAMPAWPHFEKTREKASVMAELKEEYRQVSPHEKGKHSKYYATQK